MILLALLTYNGICARFFSTLSDIEQYSKTISENVDIDPGTINWDDPRFNVVLQKLAPKGLNWLGEKIGIKRGFSVSNVQKMIKNITKTRMRQGFNKPVIQNIGMPEPGRKFIVWGELFGAFHSLVRDLQFLHKNKILSSTLKVNENYTFIFIGNVVSHSPYSLETLSVVVRLMQANPNQVFCLKGSHEEGKHWEDSGFVRELQKRAAHLSREVIPLSNLFNKFFETLPLALYISQVDGDNINTVRLGFNRFLSTKIMEQNWAGSLEKSGISILPISEYKRIKKLVRLKAIIKGEHRVIKSHQLNGLLKAGLENDAMVWILFSSPTERSKQLYKFYNDAVAQVSIKQFFKDWTITSFYQDTRKMDGFIQGRDYNLSTGQLIRKGMKDVQHLTLGSPIDLSRNPLGNALKEGMMLRFDMNEKDEKSKFYPRIEIIDDRYDPIKSREIVEAFIAKGINTILAPMGSPTVKAYLDKVEDGSIAVFFPNTGSPEFRKPELKNFVHLRAGFDTEGTVLAEYAIDKLKTEKAVLFYQDDTFGRGILKGVNKVLKDRGITNWIEIPYQRGRTDFKQQIDRIIKERPDTIFLMSTPVAAETFIRQIGVENLTNTNIIGGSDMSDQEFKSFSKSKGLTVPHLNVVPNPETSTIQIVEEYRKNAKDKNQVIDNFGLEGYIAVDVFLHALDQIEGPISNDKIIAVFENMKKYPYKGLILDFNPERRSLSSDLWMDDGSSEWERITPKR